MKKKKRNLISLQKYTIYVIIIYHYSDLLRKKISTNTSDSIRNDGNCE